MNILLCLVYLISANLAYAGGGICSPEDKQGHIHQTVKWYRNSAEKKALYNQAYRAATLYIENWVQNKKPKVKTWGVILDIDETTLDNSWYFRECGEVASKELHFSRYVANPQKSTSLPGVVAFSNLVHNLGGYVSFVSNRDGSFKDSTGSVLDTTVANLKQQNIYFDQVVLANWRDAKNPTNKNPRFEAINSGKYDAKEMLWSNTLPKYKVIAYLGDNIHDFPNFKQIEAKALDKNHSQFILFGNGYFIMPNPMYGSWQANEFN